MNKLRCAICKKEKPIDEFRRAMSQKELVLKLVMELEKWGNEGSSVYHARHLAPFIECLLAEERVRGGDALVELIKKTDALLIAEREKVMELCATEAKEQIDMAVEAKPGAKSVLGTVVANHLRQLDLTKDLAPSSREEKGNGPRMD